jgi:hypothetical protein
MAYSTAGSFADLLRQAKSQSQLRGSQLSSGEVKSIGQGYFSDALQETQAERSANLAEAQYNLSARAQAASEEANQAQLAQNADQFSKSLAQAKESTDAQKDAADKSATQGNIGTGVSALGTGGMLLRGTGIGEGIVEAVSDYLAPTATQAGANAAGTLEGGILTNMGETTASNAALTGLNGKAASDAAILSGSGATTAEGTGAATSQLTGTGSGALGAAAGTVGAAMPYVVGGVTAAHYGMPVLGKWLGAQSEEDYAKDPSSNFMDEAANITAYEWSRPVEAGMEALNIPVPGEDTLVGKLLNPGAAIYNSICIIVTACTSPNSEEVNITRQYRDKFLDQETLRGYYMIAEKVVPLINKHKWFRSFVKKHLVDNLIEYGRYALAKA